MVNVHLHFVHLKCSILTNKCIAYITPNAVKENYRMLKSFIVKESRENQCTGRHSTWKADGINKFKYCKNKCFRYRK